ncbi:MAG: roadblock/LC7 domain-containing protein [Chloroflexi bacterium]|nr:roadblock/LC7 domain-containing protein [Chloroflexota bacterium]
MNEQLDRIVQVPGVRAAVIAGRDGLVVAGRLADGAGEEMLAGVVANIFGTMDRSIQQLGLGQPIDSIVETTTHSLQMLGLGELILLVVADKQMNVAQVRREMRQLANQLGERMR